MYVKPQVLVFQEFQLASNEITDALRAWVVGPNAMLHRFDVDDEKALINVGTYDRTNGGRYPWPGREAGSVIDPSSVKLFIEDALLLYFEDLIGDDSDGRGTTTPVSTNRNWVRHSSVNFRSNGSLWPRHSLLNDRDAEIGDVVYLRGVHDDTDDCEEAEFCTTITGFAADEVAAIVHQTSNDAANAGSQEASVSIQLTSGVADNVNAVADGSGYDGISSGNVCEGYTIQVIRSSIAGCESARLRIISDSGTDNVEEIQPELGTPTPIGTRGLTVTFSEGAIPDGASSMSIGIEHFVTGQTWRVDVCQEFEEVCAENNSSYLGPDNDTYIIEVTKGGVWANQPEITITTAKGLDSSGPVVVPGANTPVPVGTYGLTISFIDCGSVPDFDGTPGTTTGDGDIAGLRRGDKFYISVLTGANGPLRTLILRDDLPLELQGADDLDLRLFIPKTIEVTENRLSNPPLKNFSIESTQLVVEAGITAFCPSWTRNGVEQPLQVFNGCDTTLYNRTFNQMFIEYTEWLVDLSNEINFIDNVADIDEIPGQLDEQNTLKWGVFRALQNSNGTRVAYTAISDPRSLESWQNSLERAGGRDDIYNYVPLTYDREVLDLFQAQVTAESSPERGNWKGMFVNLQARTSAMVIGRSDTNTQSLTPTSLDGEVVLATLSNNPAASGEQFTLLSVPDANAGFITHGVQSGDIVRFLFTLDAFGEASYQEFIVDRVLSEESLILLNGYDSEITVAQKVEIFHTFDRNETATDLVQQAQSFASNRVVATWPDIVGTGGNAQPGYFLNAALAGLASGVVPHQGLTNVEIVGFDDLASRTKAFFSGTQLDQLAAGGIWIATEDMDGTPFTRHALTTDTLDLNRREEMIRRNVDSMSYVFLRRIRPLIGRANVTDSMVQRVRYELGRVIRFFETNNFSPDLGPQLIAGTFAVDNDGVEIIRIHPLAADRIEVVLNLNVPAPLNNLELHLVI